MNPILKEFPHTFDTERLTIRSPLLGDGHIVRNAALESQEELKQWLPWAVDIPDEEEYEVNIRKGNVRWLLREDLWMMIFLKGTNTLIGGSGLHRIDWNVPKFEIGYWVHTAYAGKGYITEAVEAITAFAFEILNAERVEIRCDERNIRSAAIPKRLGFVHEGTVRNDARHHLTNALRNTMLFSKVRGEIEGGDREWRYR